MIFYVILRRKSEEKGRNKRGAPKHMEEKNARERKHQEEAENEKAKKTQQAKRTARG
jgi:hypothetical protein